MEKKQTLDTWREAAERHFSQAPGLRVSQHGYVQEFEDGAYVEMIAWVPRAALAQPPQQDEEATCDGQ